VRSKWIGRQAVCRAGKLGTVEKVTRTHTGRYLYEGTTPDGKPWQSVAPQTPALPYNLRCLSEN
jgi:hypothetical protein